MNKKIVLIQPDSPYLKTPLSFPSLGLLYISSYLRKKGYSPEFYDLTGGGNLPPQLQADIFGISCQITQFKEALKIKEELKNNNPNAIFVIGGPFPTHSSEECLKNGFVVVCGEGETAMLKIVQEYPRLTKNVYIPTEFINPNEIFPDWEAINPLRYKYQLEGKRCINIMTKRGNCPYQCTFCAKQETGKSPARFRSAENVLEEVRYLKERFGFGSVAIYDDDVLLDKERDKKIFEGLARLEMPYRCMTRTNLATKEDLKMLKDTGCAEVCIGVETADQYIHDKVIKKGTTLAQDIEFMKNCKELGLRVKVYLIMGLPSESRESIEETREWLRKIRPENFDISIFTPYPGSEIYKSKSNYEIDWDEDYLKEIWFSGEAQYNNCAVWTPFLSSEEILKFKEEIEEEFKRGVGGTTNYWGPVENEL